MLLRMFRIVFSLCSIAQHQYVSIQEFHEDRFDHFIPETLLCQQSWQLHRAFSALASR
jgi:hypothetical protein